MLFTTVSMATVSFAAPLGGHSDNHEIAVQICNREIETLVQKPLEFCGGKLINMALVKSAEQENSVAVVKPQVTGYDTKNSFKSGAITCVSSEDLTKQMDNIDAGLDTTILGCTQEQQRYGESIVTEKIVNIGGRKMAHINVLGQYDGYRGWTLVNMLYAETEDKIKAQSRK